MDLPAVDDINQIILMYFPGTTRARTPIDVSWLKKLIFAFQIFRDYKILVAFILDNHQKYKRCGIPCEA